MFQLLLTDIYMYITEMEKILGNADTYKIIITDPTKKLTTELRSMLSRWKGSNYISTNTYRSLYVSDGILPRAYGLPKIHKRNHSFRIIVSSLDNPLYHLASYLHRIMHKGFPKAQSHILNSFRLVDKLSHTLIKDNYTLISLDAVSLYTIIIFLLNSRSTVCLRDGALYPRVALFFMLNLFRQFGLFWTLRFLYLTAPYISKLLVLLWVHRYLLL